MQWYRAAVTERLRDDYARVNFGVSNPDSAGCIRIRSVIGDERGGLVHLGRLRARLGPAGGQIETVFGLGYRFAENL